MLDYCPDTKRYLVKRAVVPDSLAENGIEGRDKESSSPSDKEISYVNGQDSDPKDISINGDGVSYTEANGFCNSGAVYSIYIRGRSNVT